MHKFFACLIAFAAISIFAGESQAQHFQRGFYGGRGVSVGFNSFNRGFGGFGGSGISISVGNRGFGGFPVNRGFYGGGVPYYVARPVVPVYRAPVYGGGFYGGGVYRGGGFYGGGYRRGCGW